MASTFAKTNKETETLNKQSEQRNPICNQCGGNGYMKSSPNCYHTCLKCLGRGFILKRNNTNK